MTQQDQIELPSWHEAERNCLRNNETPLDRFIFDNEPSECDHVWRDQLKATIAEAIAHDRQQRGEPVANTHTDDDAVDHFAAAMKDKLAQARAKGRSGWHECDSAELSTMLRQHVEKGDPRDVANFCMFLWSLGHPISAPQPTEPVKVPSEPLPVFSKGPWLFRETGEEFSGAELDAAAFAVYREAAPVAAQPSMPRYTSSIGHAGQAYLDKFKYSHPLPAGFCWADLWMDMCKAASHTPPSDGQDPS